MLDFECWIGTDVEWWIEDDVGFWMVTRTAAFRSWMALFQAFEIVRCKQGAHLTDGDFIELEQALGLGNTLADENGIKALEICEDDKLLKRSMVRMLPAASGWVSRHCLEVSPNNATLSRSASLA